MIAKMAKTLFGFIAILIVCGLYILLGMLVNRIIENKEIAVIITIWLPLMVPISYLIGAMLTDRLKILYKKWSD